VFEAAIRKNISVYDKIVIENQKKWNYGNQTNFYINLHQKNGLGMEFTACQGNLDVRKSADHSPLGYVTHIATLRVRQCYWFHKVGHAQNIYCQLIIINSVWYFNLMKKFNLIGSASEMTYIVSGGALNSTNSA